MVILSHAFWQTQFASDPDILTRDLVLDGEPHRIIGVLPAGSFDRDEAVFWKPLIFAPDQTESRSALADTYRAAARRCKSGAGARPG